MQELIEQLEKEHKRFLEEDDVPNWFYKNGIKQAIKYAESLLEKEKEVLITTAADQMHLTEEEALKSAKQYYNETFKTKER